jgi:hypothetical protein
MTISYPRDLLSYEMVTSNFTLDPGTVSSRHAKGAAGTVSQVREPVWFAEFETAPMFREARARWAAWLETLSGGLKHFTAWDASQPQPLAYPDGVPAIISASWDGEATVTSLSTAGVIAVSGAAANFELTDGDKVGLVEDGVYGLYRVIESVTVNGSGVAAIPVTPLVQEMFTTSATAVLYRPKAKFQLDTSSVSIAGGVTASPIAFAGAQVLV